MRFIVSSRCSECGIRVMTGVDGGKWSEVEGLSYTDSSGEVSSSSPVSVEVHCGHDVRLRRRQQTTSLCVSDTQIVSSVGLRTSVIQPA